MVRYDDADDLLPRSSSGSRASSPRPCTRTDADADAARRLLPVLERQAGRILFNGWPTGVEVGHAMVHGGPFPATSDSRSTSVGSLRDRALPAAGRLPGRPGSDLLPEAVRDDNPWGLARRVDGELRLP